MFTRSPALATSLARLADRLWKPKTAQLDHNESMLLEPDAIPDGLNIPLATGARLAFSLIARLTLIARFPIGPSPIGDC